MIITLRLKNFFSLRDEVVLDFTADVGSRRSESDLSENLIDFSGDKFVNIIGMFGSNAAGKSNVIKAVEFCRGLVLSSHLNNEGDKLDYSPFKFTDDDTSEFAIDFIADDGIEYEYSFSLSAGRIESENLFYYPKKRRAKIFSREAGNVYSYGKGQIQRSAEIEANTGASNLFLSRASSMNRPLAQTVYRFFREQIAVGLDDFDVRNLSSEMIEADRELLLKALEVSDSDICDIRLSELVPGQPVLQSFHCENPEIPFDFSKEESDGTKRLLFLLLMFIGKVRKKATLFIDELDLKLHLRLAEFLLDVVRASGGAQLVFTSHNPALLDAGKLRREQIVFVNKNRDGSTELVPLSDYEGLGEKVDIQKAYLMGRFDGVPYVGNIYPVIKELMEGK